jgi:hypothetical protein
MLLGFPRRSVVNVPGNVFVILTYSSISCFSTSRSPRSRAYFQARSTASPLRRPVGNEYDAGESSSCSETFSVKLCMNTPGFQDHPGKRDG